MIFGQYCSASARCADWMSSLPANQRRCVPTSRCDDKHAPINSSVSCTARCRHTHQTLIFILQLAKLPGVPCARWQDIQEELNNFFTLVWLFLYLSTV